MIRKSRLAVFAVVCTSLIAAGCEGPGFDPTGSWDVYNDRFEAFSTYSSAADLSASVDFEDIAPPGTDPTIATGVAISYNAATREVILGGMTFVLDANNSTVIGEATMPILSGGCLVTEYTRVTFTFTGEEGHEALFRQESGYRFEETGVAPTCATLLAAAKMSIEATMTIPAELFDAVYLGGVRLATLEQMQSVGFAQVAVGTRVSASEGAPGSEAVQAFDFPLAYGSELLRSIRDHRLAALIYALSNAR
jgi:hypothetical protein